MKKIAFTIFLFVSLIALSACSSLLTDSPIVDDVKELKQAQRMTIISSGKPVDVLPAFKSFTWDEQYNVVLSAVNESSKKEVKNYIRDQLRTYLLSKGYHYQSDPIRADVVIGFLFALEDDIADITIQEKFGILPGLHKNSVTMARYEKGTFLLSVLDTQLKVVYWRSAMQGFVDLDKDRSDPQGMHMQMILQSMMGGFPKAGQ